MGERREPGSEILPRRSSTPARILDRAHSYGVAHVLERMRQGWVPPIRAPRIQTRRRRFRGGPAWSFRRWWATRNHRPVDVWRRLRCRTGHHDIRGGHQMQLGNRFVYVERRCIWCDAAPPS